MSLHGTVNFQYFGISPTESEVIYNILSSIFEVNENVISQDFENISTIEIKFPMVYGEEFFQFLGKQRWKKIKELFMEMKRRRGSKRLRIILSFLDISSENNQEILFSLFESDISEFEAAIEKIEYLVELILIQVNKFSNQEKVIFTYDSSSKWVISIAK